MRLSPTGQVVFCSSTFYLADNAPFIHHNKPPHIMMNVRRLNIKAKNFYQYVNLYNESLWSLKRNLILFGYSFRKT
jgi:hypothetical protein